MRWWPGLPGRRKLRRRPRRIRRGAELRGIVENVAGATGKQYAVRDDAGHVMDTVKIIQDSTGGYLAVSHHLTADGHFRVNLASSTNLLNWHWVRELAEKIVHERRSLMSTDPNVCGQIEPPGGGRPGAEWTARVRAQLFQG